MVAEATKPSTSRKGRGHAPAIDLLTRSQARNLYVVRQLSAQEVANFTGLSVKQVYSLAARDGWTKSRSQIREREERLSREREEADVKEMVDAVAIKNKVLTLGTLDEAIDELANGGEFKAKNLQALSVAAKNFNGMWREAKALDVQDAQGQGAQINVMFVGSLPRSAARSTVNVTPSEASVSVAALPTQSEQPAIDVRASGSTQGSDAPTT